MCEVIVGRSITEEALSLEGIRLEFSEYSIYLHRRIGEEAGTKYIPKRF